MTPLQLAGLFHDTYETLAPAFGYQTRPETRKFKPTTPNGRLMLAVCTRILDKLSKEHRCQHCGSHRPFKVVYESDKLGDTGMNLCMDCGRVQGPFPYPEGA
jgi:ribosomal protein S14